MRYWRTSQLVAIIKVVGSGSEREDAWYGYSPLSGWSGKIVVITLERISIRSEIIFGLPAMSIFGSG